MRNYNNFSIQRRSLLKTISAAALPGEIGRAVLMQKASASENVLRILRWKNFIPEFEHWFNDVFVKEWSERNDTRVIVTNVGMGEVDRLAAAEAQAQQGHDMVLFLSSRPLLEDHAIDHREIFEECESRYGTVHDFIHRACYNPATEKYHGFCESYIPVLTTYRQDLWDAIGLQPSTWDDVRKGGRAIKLLHDSPVGISLAPEHNSERTLRALMSSFGASVQDQDNNLSILSKETIESLKFFKALYEETMTPDVEYWTPPSNNQFMLAGTGCLTVDSISIIRAAQSQQFPVNRQLSLTTIPEGPAGQSGPVFGLNTYVIWRFARNIIAAKKFIVDYMARLSEGIQISGFQNLPSYPNAVPGFDEMLKSDIGPAGRYDIINKVPNTQTNPGYPGYSNAAIDEVFGKHIISNMFLKTATDKHSPRESVEQANAAIKPIYEKWRRLDKI